ncbi:ABC transporter ATP-binding protein [bacterium]|nr:ABC transporter ATP-binding protein [bacterium]
MLDSLLKVTDLKTGYDQKIVSEKISLEVYPAELICILGPNGAGKSTLLKTIAKLLPSKGGEIHFSQKNLRDIAIKELSKHLAVVLTDRIIIEYMNVLEFISLGRFPYTNIIGTLQDQDKKVIDHIIKQLHLQDLQCNDLSNLSDGQRQRVMIARALVQDTGLVILDEPTAFLDLPSKVELMNLLSKLCSEHKTSFLVSTHDLDLALSHADRIWLVDQNGKLHDGAPEDLVLAGVFNQVFDSKYLTFDLESSTFINRAKDYLPISIEAQGLQKLWIERALLRLGFKESSKDSDLKVLQSEDGWIIEYSDSKKQYSSIYSLCKFLKSKIN